MDHNGYYHNNGPMITTHINNHLPNNHTWDSSGSMTSDTNKNDPYSRQCRLFVGNLNTIAMQKDEIYKIFSQYGPITGLSTHKGYAFIQYTNPQNAKIAAEGEHGKSYYNFTLDCNVVSEKDHKLAAKQQLAEQQMMQRGSGPQVRGKPQRSNTNMKQSFTKPTQSLSNQINNQSWRSSKTTPSYMNHSVHVKGSKVNSNNPSDILVCGVCRSIFNDANSFNDHKKSNCQLKFTCVCNQIPAQLRCEKCDKVFSHAWSFLQHLQRDHNMKLYKPIQNGPHQNSSATVNINMINNKCKEEIANCSSPESTAEYMPSSNTEGQSTGATPSSK